MDVAKWNEKNAERDALLNQLDLFADNSQLEMDWEVYCYLKMLVQRERICNLIANNYEKRKKKAFDRTV